MHSKREMLRQRNERKPILRAAAEQRQADERKQRDAIKRAAATPADLSERERPYALVEGPSTTEPHASESKCVKCKRREREITRPRRLQLQKSSSLESKPASRAEEVESDLHIECANHSLDGGKPARKQSETSATKDIRKRKLTCRIGGQRHRTRRKG